MKAWCIRTILLSLGVLMSAQGQPSDPPTANTPEVHLTATVEGVVPLTGFPGHVIPAGLAPKFALKLRIGTVTPVLDELVPGSEVTFAIDNPALLFEGDPDRSLVYDFYLMLETDDGNARFGWLSTHRACAEDEVVGYPLNGWVGTTNTGYPVAEMTITAQTTPNGPTIATAKSDSTGRFAFPTLGPGKYYLNGKRREVDAIISADDVVTIRKGKDLIVCLVADWEISP